MYRKQVYKALAEAYAKLSEAYMFQSLDARKIKSAIGQVKLLTDCEKLQSICDDLKKMISQS